ncbi:hypothetical protein L3X38_018441 [Prunus dulcis]|uniref:RNase H type-1 domain-containing protein n=1 Tax=Prunus dulcis TaxID=3755 RepID=A0AAD4WAT7_PRUDU|nr:hypothetical protein L3X38_018441 [Prunus dulcis]
MTTQSSEPPAQPTSAATALALMDHLAVGPVGSQAPASSASSVAQPVSARRRYRPASTTETTSTDASGSQPCDFVKIHVDGGWIGDTLKGGVGVVIRNTGGQFVGGLAGPICCDSALAAEAYSAIKGLALIYGSVHEVGWSWVHRDLNRAAHEAAMIGVRAMELESWVSRPPLSLVQVLVSDGLPCPP